LENNYEESSDESVDDPPLHRRRRIPAPLNNSTSSTVNTQPNTVSSQAPKVTSVIIYRFNFLLKLEKK